MSLTFLQECIPNKTIKQIKSKMTSLNLTLEETKPLKAGTRKTTTVEKMLSSPVKKFECLLLCGASFKTQKLATAHQQS